MVAAARPNIENPPVVIRTEDVSKRFVLRKDKSLKERIVNFGRSQRHRERLLGAARHRLRDRRGTTVGLIGATAPGKSTLLKVIGGIIQTDSGFVERRGRIAALLELGAGFHPDLTGRENVYLNASILGLSQKQTAEYFDAIVEFSEIGDFIDTQVKFYSSGMYVRLAFAVAVHVDPDILLVDEVLAVGDEPFQRKCMDKIREFQQRGSHDRLRLAQRSTDRGPVRPGGRALARQDRLRRGHRRRASPRFGELSPSDPCAVGSPSGHAGRRTRPVRPRRDPSRKLRRRGVASDASDFVRSPHVADPPPSADAYPRPRLKVHSP